MLDVHESPFLVVPTLVTNTKNDRSHGQDKRSRLGTLRFGSVDWLVTSDRLGRRQSVKLSLSPYWTIIRRSLFLVVSVIDPIHEVYPFFLPLIVGLFFFVAVVVVL